MTMIISGSTGLEFPDGSDQTTAFTNNSPTFTGTVAVEALTASGNVSLDSNTLFVDSVNNNVGIGTSSPSQKVEIYDSTTAAEWNGLRVFSEANASGTSYSYINLEKAAGYGGAVAGYLQQGVGSGLAFFSNNGGTKLERMRIDSSGNVGIGVTPSASASGDCKQIALGGLNYLSSTSGTSGKANFYTGLYYNAYQTGQSTFNAIVSNSSSDYLPSAYVQFQGVHRWLTASSATAGSAISFTQAMELDNSGNLKFNSGYGSVATAYGCRAWVNFNGTGTVAIRGSGNVSSITDNGTGNYIVNFSTSMPDSDYSVVALGNTGSNNGYMTLISTSTGSCNIITRTSSSLGPDGTIICAAVFR